MSRRERILVVEDERAQRDPLVRYLAQKGYLVDAAASGEEALKRVTPGRYAVVLTDLRLPGIDGLAVVRRVRAVDEELGVLLMTAYASVESAIEALRLGAHDYLLKPIILDDVVRKIANLMEHRRLVAENARLRGLVQERQSGPELVTESAAMKEVLGWARRAATSSQANVLLIGETGTGKEVVARRIHSLSPHADDVFLAVNLAATPEGLVESELFGHERGSFTGADKRRHGILRSAGQGTVFLDEIGELPLPAQAKLLRVLEAREVKPVGSDDVFPFEARIIAATHRNLEEMIADGRFREDLYYRLNVIRIEIPPLRERPEDIPMLVRHLLAQHAERNQRRVPAVSADAMRALCSHRWRGNVRELGNVLERALILADDHRIELDHLPQDVTGSASDGMGLAESVERFERGHIALVLRLCGGNREAAARELGISPATLYRRLEKLGLKERGAGLSDVRVAPKAASQG